MAVAPSGSGSAVSESAASELAVDLAGEAVDLARAGIGYQIDAPGLPWFEPDCRPSRNVETEAPRLFPVEGQRAVRLEEMIVGTDLDRPVAGIGDLQADGFAAVVQGDLTGLDEQFTRDHGNSLLQRIGRWTVTSFVPSGNVASTWISWIISGMPGMTCSRVITSAPSRISSATLRPSRAPSTTKSVMRAMASGYLSLTPRSRRRRATTAAMATSSLSFSRGDRFMAPSPSQ